jgi:hypothetical protein
VADEELKTKSSDAMVLTERRRRGLKEPRGVTGVLVKISVLLSLCPSQIPHESPWDRELTLIIMMLRILNFLLSSRM